MRSQFGEQPGPDIGDVVARVGEMSRSVFGRFGSGLLIVILLVLAISGVYKVGPGEIAVVRTFGRETAKRGPGLRFKVPLVQKVDVVNVEQIRRIEVGFRDKEPHIDEAQMITGDANIVEVHMIVQYRVIDPTRYLFRLRDPDETLRASAEVALRGVVGQTSIDDVITTGREKVQADTQEWLQRLIDDYDSGIRVTEVKLQAVDAPDAVRDAFHEVVRAREEKEKLINQAMGYNADLIPRARGEVRKIVREAEGYREQRVLEAKGDSEKFDTTYAEYKKAERVTRKRLYLESMERILAKTPHKVLVDERLSKSALPIFPLGAPAAAAPTTAGGKP
jgi:membrane protease subunit HflK